MCELLDEYFGTDLYENSWRVASSRGMEKATSPLHSKKEIPVSVMEHVSKFDFIKELQHGL